MQERIRPLFYVTLVALVSQSDHSIVYQASCQ